MIKLQKMRGALAAASITLVTPAAFAQAPRSNVSPSRGDVPSFVVSSLDRSFQAVATDVAAQQCDAARADLKPINDWIAAAQLNVRADAKLRSTAGTIREKLVDALDRIRRCDAVASAAEFHRNYLAKQAAPKGP